MASIQDQPRSSLFEFLAYVTRPAISTGERMTYYGNQQDRVGQQCEVFHAGQTISRIRFADGYRSVAFNHELRPDDSPMEQEQANG